MRLHITVEDEPVTELGSIADTGHDWDDDPVGWARQQLANQRLRSCSD